MEEDKCKMGYEKETKPSLGFTVLEAIHWRYIVGGSVGGGGWTPNT